MQHYTKITSGKYSPKLDQGSVFFCFFFPIFAQEKVTCKKYHAFPSKIALLGVFC